MVKRRLKHKHILHKKTFYASLAGLVAGLILLSYVLTSVVPLVSAIAAQAAGTPSLHLRHWNSSSMNYAINNAGKFRVIMLNSWEYGSIAQIKAHNPGVKVLVYKDLSSTRSYACGDAFLPAGVDYCDANTNHPDWFLKDGSNNRLQYGGYSGHWQMDIGNHAYITAWISNVKADLQAHGWDGVIMDNALVRGDQYHGGVYPGSYPNNTSFQAAYTGALNTIGSNLRSSGLIATANISDARLYTGIWNTYTQNLDGAYDEFFMVWSANDYNSDYGANGWVAQINEIKDLEAAGKFAIVRAQTNGTDATGALYGYANFLLATGGRSVFDEGSPDDSVDPATTPWPNRAQYAWDLGAASGAYTSLGNSVYRRDFANGVVIVNAKSTAYTATVVLGANYYDANGAVISSVTLSARSAAILRKVPIVATTNPTSSPATTSSGTTAASASSGQNVSPGGSSTKQTTPSSGSSQTANGDKATSSINNPPQTIVRSLAQIKRISPKKYTAIIGLMVFFTVASAGILAILLSRYVIHFTVPRPYMRLRIWRGFKR